MKRFLAILLLAAMLFSFGCSKGEESSGVVDIEEPVDITPKPTSTPAPTEAPVVVYSPSGNGFMAAGNGYSLGVRADGKVLTAGLASSGQTGVGSWSDVVYADAAEKYSVGLTKGGTLLLAGNTEGGIDEALNWTNINMVQTGTAHILGLGSDARVLAAGDNSQGQCDVSNWSKIVEIAAAADASYGLKSDGTVVMAGSGFDVSTWSNITSIAAGDGFVLGLKKSGSVVMAGSGVNVEGWGDVKSLSANSNVAAALTYSGTVLTSPNFEGVSAIGGAEQVAAGKDCVLVLKNDGTVDLFGSADGFLQDANEWTLRVPEGQEYPAAGLRYADKIEAAEAVNSDVVGWIQLDGTNIDYPIMTATSDFKYNYYNWKGEEDKVGSVYMYTSTKLQGQFQALTAHNNRKRAGTDTSMFHELHHIYEYNLGLKECRHTKDCDAEYTDAIPKLTEQKDRIWRIDINGEEALWEVFSVYLVEKDKKQETQMENIWWDVLTGTGSKSEEDVRKWIDTQIERSEIDLGVEVGTSDELLTVLTCATTSSQADNGGRLYFILHRVG